MKMLLRGLGNPDYQQFCAVADARVVCGKSVQDLQSLARQYINYWNLGAGNLPPCPVFMVDPVQCPSNFYMGYFSYNLRFWVVNDRPETAVYNHYRLYNSIEAVDKGYMAATYASESIRPVGALVMDSLSHSGAIVHILKNGDFLFQGEGRRICSDSLLTVHQFITHPEPMKGRQNDETRLNKT